MIFLITGAPLFWVNWSSWMASAASRPRTRSAIMRAFRGAIRENLALALLFISRHLTWIRLRTDRASAGGDRRPDRGAAFGGVSGAGEGTDAPMVSSVVVRLHWSA